MLFLIDIIFFTNLYFLFKLRVKKNQDKFESLFVSGYKDLFTSILVSSLFFFIFFVFMRLYKFVVPHKQYIDLGYFYDFTLFLLHNLTECQKKYLILFLVFSFFKYHFLRVHFFLRTNSYYRLYFEEFILIDSRIKLRLGSRYIYYSILKDNGFKFFLIIYIVYFALFSDSMYFYVGFLKYYALYYFFLRFFNYVPKFCSDFDDGVTSFYNRNSSLTALGFHKLRLYGLYLVYDRKNYFFVLVLCTFLVSSSQAIGFFSVCLKVMFFLLKINFLIFLDESPWSFSMSIASLFLTSGAVLFFHFIKSVNFFYG